MNQPQSIANELTCQLNEAMRRKVTEFEVASLRKKANSLVKVEPAAGYDALGMIAALVWDYSESIHYHKKAMTLEPNEEVLILNFVVSLNRLGAVHESIYWAERALEVAREAENINYLHRMLFESFFKAGYVKKALEARDHVVPDDDEEEGFEALSTRVEIVFEFMKKHALSDVDVSQYVSILEGICRKHDLASESEMPYTCDDTKASLLCLHKRIIDDADKAADLNEELAELISSGSSLPAHITSIVSGGFLSATA